MEIKNKHTGDKGQFEVYEHDNIAGVLEYEMQSANVLKATHTKTKPGFEGKGVGTKLFNAMVAYVQENNLKVNPVCDFVKSKMGKNEAMKELIAKANDQ